MEIDRLIRGNPYIWTDKGGNERKVLYHRTVNLPNNVLAFNFRFEHGFVNLLKADVLDNIRLDSSLISVKRNN